VAVIGQKFRDRLSARIRGFIPGIADGNDETSDAFFGFFFMLVNRHDATPEMSMVES
jgi:hypothetical protein